MNMEREDIDEKTPHIIAGSYQILQQIGSEGGGIVVFRSSSSSDKMIVLKADRRTQKLQRMSCEEEKQIF